MPAMNAPQDNGLEDADEALVERARTGDLTACEELFNRYSNQMYSLACRMTGSDTDAEDICQEVFLRVIRKVGSFKGRSSFSTWLYRVAMNYSKDYLRQKKRRQEILSQQDDPPESRAGTRENDSTGLECAVIASEARLIVQDALAKLPPSLRAPLALHELEGMRYREVAGLLRLPVGTVKSRIFRARIKLAETLEPHKEQWR
ncbi:MAG: RNA polymerase sigma factor RpoE [Candidatus Anoxymicrobium japonicum]|uniref:RNA polymerase sigma factor RpoE n=1 Tax=Candidatus Anoxymicrobium japonicum TaxID=2013648 RepID=A0A2N3G534_9ACTN|nr:MAG: RNA polymerase sigma factor RpoE [Candidatus Anoxymicrobium japonicum]